MQAISQTRWKLLGGTLRRFYLTVFRPGYVRANLAKRQGACRRCGACCKLVWQCLHFYHDDGVPACRLYKLYRPQNCSKFPIDHRDIADRNLVPPHEPCGYSWPRAE